MPALKKKNKKHEENRKVATETAPGGEDLKRTFLVGLGFRYSVCSVTREGNVKGFKFVK